MRHYFLYGIFSLCSSVVAYGMSITSPAFVEGGMIPRHYTCDGDRYSPPLVWSNVPPTAKSLVIIIDDPDAPKHTFVHWIVFNILPINGGIPERMNPQSVSAAVEGTNTGGNVGYTALCPYDGLHRYFFKLYALDTLLDLKNDATYETVNAAMQGHILAHASLMGRYVRQQS